MFNSWFKRAMLQYYHNIALVLLQYWDKLIYTLQIHIRYWKTGSIGLFLTKRSDQLLSYFGLQKSFKSLLYSYFGYYEGGPIEWEI